MSLADEKLKNIAEQLKRGVAPPKETVRSFLLWFGFARRGYRVVHWVRHGLEQYGLTTQPDFEYAYIDGYISFATATGVGGKAERSGATSGTAAADPTYRIGRLESANSPPVSVNPDSTLQQVVTLMLTSDFSQLPVMSGTREVKGVVSWKTIGSRLSLKKDCPTARECMEPAHVVLIEESLFSAIEIIAAHDYVLVRGTDQQISGIITASDFNEQFRKLAEPFLLVGEIENGIRRMLHGKFTVSELKAACDPDGDSDNVEGVTDLSFGGYIRLIQEDSQWKKLKLEIDRVEFIKRLDTVRKIRNDVMHFDPDGLEPEDLTTLTEFAQFLKRMRDVGAM
ncbi:MAG TPA: CBS domain-containing protein [Chthoniobacterales bacterium]|jgi:CBS domain-containing protein|nr:CBS domain-containing protein [Chthoniobacterales bacterium]